MASRQRGGFGPRPFDRGGRMIHHGAPPPRHMIFTQRSGERPLLLGRFPPPGADMRAPYFGPNGPRPRLSQPRGFPLGGRGLHTRGQMHRQRFERSPVVKPEAGEIASQLQNVSPRNEMLGDIKSEEEIKKEFPFQGNNMAGAGNTAESSEKQEDATGLQSKLRGGRNVEVRLDDYNCDLHFNSDEAGLTGWTLHTNGFEYLWGGGRATHGVDKGKVAYECIVLEALAVDVPDTERNPHVLRVGWSVDGADLQLGEDLLSYGYGGTGKISVNSKFTDYGRKFGVGDVITCCVDLDARPSAIFYLLNGEYLGVAFKIGPELNNKALFPHITGKNMKFQVNFGHQWPRYPIEPGFSLIQNAASQHLVQALVGPKSRHDAEMIMMVGLPSCGKTVWAEKYCREHPNKRFYLLGTNSIIEKMRVFGLTRKGNYHGRWDALIKKATGCLNTWLKIAEKRVRNYILDQTNVYFTARRRKMNSFRGYKRIACVIINEENVLAERVEKVQKEEGKVVPESAVMEMKANFNLPEVGESFDEVRYIEAKPPKVMQLVKAFVGEGQAFKRGHGPSSSEQEPRPKVPRIESQRPVGGDTHARRGTSEHGLGRDRTRQPYPDGRYRNPAGVYRYELTDSKPNTSDGGWYGPERAAGYESQQSIQERNHSSWNMQQSIKSPYSGLGVGDQEGVGSNYRGGLDTRMKQEPFDVAQRYGNNQRKEQVSWQRDSRAHFGASRNEGDTLEQGMDRKKSGEPYYDGSGGEGMHRHDYQNDKFPHQRVPFDKPLQSNRDHFSQKPYSGGPPYDEKVSNWYEYETSQSEQNYGEGNRIQHTSSFRSSQPTAASQSSDIEGRSSGEQLGWQESRSSSSQATSYQRYPDSQQSFAARKSQQQSYKYESRAESQDYLSGRSYSIPRTGIGNRESFGQQVDAGYAEQQGYATQQTYPWRP